MKQKPRHQRHEAIGNRGFRGIAGWPRKNTALAQLVETGVSDV